MQNRIICEVLLALVRLGIGHQPVINLPANVDSGEVKRLAEKHGLAAVVLDGIDYLNINLPKSSIDVPKPIKLEWIGEVLQNYEHRYKAYEQAISSLAGFYNQHHFKMMVLKGYACSLDWPKPEHRPSGDIDIWQFGKQKESDTALTQERNVKIDDSHHHHTVFDWNGFSVENHYDFINVHHHKSNVEFEAILKKLGQDDSHYVEVNGVRVYLPSPNLHALFLLKHITMHFAAEGIMLRQLLDWAFFVEKHGNEVDWDYVDGVLEQFGMKNMFNIINAICVGDLGFDVKIFPAVQFDPSLKDMVLNDILSPEYGLDVPKCFFQRVPYKIRRWKANEWKHRLCYNDSMWSAFWSGVWNHLLKPSSI